MSGLEASEVIRKQLQQMLPILGFSAEISKEIRVQCASVGMQGFVPKPASMAQLGRELQKHLPRFNVGAGMSLSDAPQR
jgi:CheY-like chemotaxis protein